MGRPEQISRRRALLAIGLLGVSAGALVACAESDSFDFKPSGHSRQFDENPDRPLYATPTPEPGL